MGGLSSQSHQSSDPSDGGAAGLSSVYRVQSQRTRYKTLDDELQLGGNLLETTVLYL